MALTYYVDTDNAGGGRDGLTLGNAWNTLTEAVDGLKDNATINGEEVIVLCTGATDNAFCYIQSFTSTPTKLTVQAASGDEAVTSGIDTARFLVTEGGGDPCIYINMAITVELIGLQLENTQDGSQTCVTLASDSDLFIDSCYLNRVFTGAGAGKGLRCNNAGTQTITVRNSILVGGDTTDGDGVDINNGVSTINIQNCVVHNFNKGLTNGSATTFNVVNTAIFDCVTDLSGTFSSVTYCATDDVTTGTGNIDSLTWANVFEDYTNGDFSLKTTDTNLTDAGDELNATFTNSMNGQGRGITNWDIGAFQSAGGGGGTTLGPLFIKRPWTRHPPEKVDVDWTHPLAKNLKKLCVFYPSGPVVHTRTRREYFVKNSEPVENPTYATFDGVDDNYRAESKAESDAWMQNYSITGNDATYIVKVRTAGQPTGERGAFFMYRDAGGSTDGVGLWVGDGPTDNHLIYGMLSDNFVGQTPISSSTINDNSWHQVAFRISGNGSSDLAIDGVQDGSVDSNNLTANTIPEQDARMTLGDGDVDTTISSIDEFNGDMELFGYWDSVLSEPELKRFNDNPWQIFKPKTIFVGKPDALNQRLVRF